MITCHAIQLQVSRIVLHVSGIMLKVSGIVFHFWCTNTEECRHNIYLCECYPTAQTIHHLERDFVQ